METPEITLTEKETLVLRKLHEQVKKVTKGKTPTAKLVKSIITMCSAWNFAKILADEDPAEIARVCHSLQEKGMIKIFDADGLPSYVPVNQTTLVEFKYREFTQHDVL